MTETPVLLTLLLLVAAAAWLLARSQRPRFANSPLLRVIAAVQVGPRERVVIVEAEDAWLVLGVAPGRVHPIHTLTRRADVALEPRRPFAEWLRKVAENHAVR
jgi:flagellar protein FliO/FliZ